MTHSFNYKITKMRNLLNFFIKYSAWVLFLIYVVISCILLFSNNPYQHHIYLTSANKIASSLYGTTNNISTYFNLQDINEDLHKQNTVLELENIALKEQLRQYQERYYADTMTTPAVLKHYDIHIAHVINNSISRPHNYITIDKGKNDSITTEMGVIDQNGVVGIVNLVSDNNARIISLLNPNFRLSCKVKGNNSFGSLVWDGKYYDEAVLEELPRHTIYNVGDTVITSGYSAVFPEGIPVGVVLAQSAEDDDNFFKLRIKLFTDFSRLSTVKVIRNNQKPELKSIENQK